MDEIYKQSAARISDAMRRSGELVDGFRFNHFCSADLCSPVNERELIGRRLLRAPPLTDCVYVCQYGQQHICTEQECTLHVQGVCPVSGACYGPKGGYSAYDKDNPMTWGRDYHTQELANALAAPPSQKEAEKSRRQKIKRSNLKDAISTVIGTLLYSPKRHVVNREKERDDERKYARAAQIYAKECQAARVPPSLIWLMMLRDDITSDRLKLEILEYNEGTVAKYLDLVLGVYNKVRKYHTESIKVDVLTLGVLYEMQQGYVVDNIVLLPCDTFLLYNLPSINDLPTFGIDKKKISMGQKMIEMAFKSALSAGAPLKEIAHTE